MEEKNKIITISFPVFRRCAGYAPVPNDLIWHKMGMFVVCEQKAGNARVLRTFLVKKRKSIQKISTICGSY